MTVNGVDVSRWQATTPNLTGLGFLFARATYNTSPDPRYAQHIAAARRAGLVTGAYHFGVNAPVAAQVSAFLAAAGDVDFYVLDLEPDGGRPRMTDDQARAFIAGVKAHGKRCYLYHSRSGFPSLGQSGNWVASWTATPPAMSWTFWQYSGTGIDRDRFNGSLADLRALAGHPLPPSTGPQVVAYASSTPAERANKMIAAAYGVTTTRIQKLAKDQPLFLTPGGPRVTRMSRAGDVAFLGRTGSWGVVIVGTGAPYADRVIRPTGLYVPLAAGPIANR